MPTNPTHAGAVTFRMSNNQRLYLIISSSNGIHWVLSKGHIKAGESPETAALRELKEETGVIGEIVERLPIQRFAKSEGEVIVQYFLIRGLESTEASEKRSLRWEDEQTALELLSFEDSREILRNAVSIGFAD